MKGVVLKAFCRFARRSDITKEQIQLIGQNSSLREESYFSSRIYDDRVFNSIFESYLTVVGGTSSDILRSFGRFIINAIKI